MNFISQGGVEKWETPTEVLIFKRIVLALQADFNI
jgi:hypothetical protein